MKKGDRVQIVRPCLEWAHGREVEVLAARKKCPVLAESSFFFNLDGTQHTFPQSWARVLSE